MKLIKYDRLKKGSNGSSTIINNNNSSNNEGGINPPSRGDGDNRNIWGQYDDGGDIDGSMTVNGNVSIKAIIPPTYDPDEEGGDGEDIEEETGGGNLDVELTITSNKVEANEVFAKNHLYINYPHPTGSKQCVVDLIKSNADNINSNTTKINNLTTTVNNHTTQINNLNTSVTNNTTNISNNTTEINKIKETINAGVGITEDRVNEILNNWKYGNYGRPVILATGKIRKSSVSGSKYWFWDGTTLDSMYNVNLDWTGGLMTFSFEASNNFTNYIYSVHATQMKSGDTGDTVENTSINGRNDGAHWFETRFDNTLKKVYIREFHQKDGNNDSWGTDYWGGDGGGIKEVAITIIGYAYKTATTAEEAALMETQSQSDNNSDNTDTETELNEIN